MAVSARRLSAPAQTLRALTLAVVASGSATLAHAAGGGHLVSGGAVLAATALLAGAALPFVRGALTLRRAAVLLSLLQVAAHVVHSLAALAGHASAVTTPTGHAAHGSHWASAAVSPSAGATASGMPLSAGLHTDHAPGLAGLLPSPTMLLAHLTAALLVGLLLARGEQSWRVTRTLLAASLERVVARLVGAALAAWAGIRLVATGGSAPQPDRGDRAPATDVWQALTPARRGPPLLPLT